MRLFVLRHCAQGVLACAAVAPLVCATMARKGGAGETEFFGKPAEVRSRETPLPSCAGRCDAGA